MNNDNIQQQQQWQNVQNIFCEQNKTKNTNSNNQSKLNKNNNNNLSKKICCQLNNINININSNNSTISNKNNNNSNNNNVTTIAIENFKNVEKQETLLSLSTSTATTTSPSSSTPTQLLPSPHAAATTVNECDKRNFVSLKSKKNSIEKNLDFICKDNNDDNENDDNCVFYSASTSSNRQTNSKRKHLNSKTTKTKRTFYNNRDDAFLYRSVSVSGSGFYRILFLCLQLSAALFSFSFNIGFTLADNFYDDNDVLYNNLLNTISDNSDVDNNSGGDGNLSGSSEYGDDSNFGHYTHTWAVHIPNGNENDLADQVAKDHGFINLGKIFDDHYHFAHHKVSKRSLEAAETHQTRLDEDERVHWSKQQRVKSRQKRDLTSRRFQRTSPRALSLVDAVILNDPKWSQMWYLNRGGGLDMNVIPAWKEGITGKGIVVTILDDGLESDHPDIEHNYDPMASYDVNSHDNDPMPHYDMTDSNRHGTRCAGEVAATANNSICAVGIAFGASVGGVRMLDGDVTDAVEARSLSLNPQHIDIYSASWGPDDDGKTVDGPGELASHAFIEGVTKGRGGKGSIFIWASGNGGRELDNCNCDGYTNSIWTLSISSATEDGHVPWYSEKCSSTLATTYSSGSQGEKQVVTTDLHHSCTVSHTGTSASAPLAAGIAALVLESNNNLTWRDLQHIVVRTAKPANLKDPTWTKNGVGRRISHSFGYGLMDAAAMVRVARNWKTVPEQQRCEINAPHVDKTIPAEGYITLQLAVKHCLSVNYLEHVQAKITLTSQRRGDIQLFLRSPAGTKVTLLTNRQHDNSRIGFNQWPFMSVHTWGESPHGNWQLEIHNEGRFKAQITQWDLIFYGTETPAQPGDPIHLTSGKYNSFGNDMEHNDIEFDASGQWHNMQQVGESSVKSHDRTNTACTKFTIDQRCLACAPPTFLFNYHCYDECPRHTYVFINNLEPTSKNDIIDNDINKLSELEEPLESMDKKRKRQRRDRDILTTHQTPSQHTRECHICDSSCYQCFGPLNSECSTCYPGGQLRKFGNETFCYNFAERSATNGGDNSNSNFFEVNPKTISLNLITSASIFLVLIIIIIVFVRYRLRRDSNQNDLNKVQYSYDRVALLNDDETETDLAKNNNDVERNSGNMKTNYDSESEDEYDVFNVNDEKS